MHNRQAYLFLTFTMLFWGCNTIVGRLAVGHVSPMVLNTLRFLVAAVVLGWLCRGRLRQEWPLLRANAGLLIILGTLGMTGFGIALYAALTRTTAINASIVQASMPMFVFIINFAVFHMAVRAGQALGFVLSLIGVALTVTHGDLAQLLSLQLNSGDAFMLVGVVFYGIYTALLRFRPPLHWQTFMFALVCVGFVTSLPFGLYEWMTSAASSITPRGWGLVLFAGLGPSLLAQVFYVRGVELIGPNRAGLFINLVPIFGTLLSIAILGEAFHPYHAVALCLVLGGIALAERSGRRSA